ncbi:RNA polymerase sigma factor [Gimesia aquarii]|uniref:RNA polymerase sigma factor n=2 Tax=Gimesia aquarii TaxID=2527964 RepID=A0A517VXJ7_9PLAN|nr:RNA polymerase sigma factor [Gimesia aquarii]
MAIYSVCGSLLVMEHSKNILRYSNHASSSRDEEAERFVRLFTENERRIRSYLYNFLPGNNEVDEVMQEISTVLWKKFGELEDDSGFLPWAYVIARYEILMYRRRLSRDRLVFGEGLLTTLSEEYANEEEHERGEIRKALDGCLNKLTEEDRRLLMVAYGGGMKVNQLAEQLDRTVNSVYKNISRLRRRLEKCVRLQTEASVR